jgi:hypothetical protein
VSPGCRYPLDWEAIFQSYSDKSSAIAALVRDNYKVLECLEYQRTGSCRNVAAKLPCFFWHDNQDRRRDPQIVYYTSTRCIWCEPADREACSKSHNLVEQMYHSHVFRTMECKEWVEKEGRSCSRGLFCAFYHGSAGRGNEPAVDHVSWISSHEGRRPHVSTATAEAVEGRDHSSHLGNRLENVLLRYRTEPCLKLDCPKPCFDYHDASDFRRSPLCGYRPELCEANKCPEAEHMSPSEEAEHKCPSVERLLPHGVAMHHDSGEGAPRFFCESGLETVREAFKVSAVHDAAHGAFRRDLVDIALGVCACPSADCTQGLGDTAPDGSDGRLCWHQRDWKSRCLRCSFAHSECEVSFHPLRYKLDKCQNLEHKGWAEEGSHEEELLLCSHNHNVAEKLAAGKVQERLLFSQPNIGRLDGRFMNVVEDHRHLYLHLALGSRIEKSLEDSFSLLGADLVGQLKKRFVAGQERLQLPVQELFDWVLRKYFLHPDGVPAGNLKSFRVLFQSWLEKKEPTFAIQDECVVYRGEDALQSPFRWNAFTFNTLCPSASEFFRASMNDRLGYFPGSDQFKLVRDFFTGADPFNAKFVSLYQASDIDFCAAPSGESPDLTERGSFGVVHKGRLVGRYGEEVAIKLSQWDVVDDKLNPVAAMLMEASLLLQCRCAQSAKVVKLLGILWAPVYGRWTVGLVMKQYGQSLATLLRAKASQHGRQSPVFVLELLRSVNELLLSLPQNGRLIENRVASRDDCVRLCCRKTDSVGTCGTSQVR